MKHLAIAIAGITAIFLVIFFVAPMRYVVQQGNAEEVKVQDKKEAKKDEPEILENDVSHVATPKYVRSLYLSSWGAGSKTLRAHVMGLIDQSDLINAVVIDIKDDTGKLSYIPPRAELEAYKTYENRIPDLKDFIKQLHEKGVYVIGRVSIFQDPTYAKLYPEDAYKKVSDPSSTWVDRKGLAFVRVDAQPFWKYIALIADVSYRDMGFDEINFDYIRYPTDGNIKDINYNVPVGSTRADQVALFAQHMKNTLDPKIVRSADLFGMVVSAQDDLGIGQKFERLLPLFDYIAPMVYPSHYPPQFHGYAKPATVPYEIIDIAMGDAVKKITQMHTIVDSPAQPATVDENGQAVAAKPAVTHVDQEAVARDVAKLRPWVQDFDYGAQYGTVEVQAQFKAFIKHGIQGFMVWDPNNKFTPEAYTVLNGIQFKM